MATAGDLADKVVEAASFSGPASYVRNWGESIVGGHSSKNIPWLGAAVDALLAWKWQDQQMLGQVLGEARRNLSQYHDPMRGEEFSSIYSRWIVIPVDVIRHVARAAGDEETFIAASNWLRGIISWQALNSSNGQSYRRSSWCKDSGKTLSNLVRGTGWGGSRSWSSGKTNGSRKTNGLWNNIVWGDTQTMNEWLAATLNWRLSSTVGGDGDWVAKIYRGMEKHLPEVPRILRGNDVGTLSIVASADVLSPITIGAIKQAISWAKPYAPTGVAVNCVRTKTGSCTWWSNSFHNGSTGTMLVKSLGWLDSKMYIYGGTEPSRTNRHALHTEMMPDDVWAEGYMEGVKVINDEPDKAMVNDDRKSISAKEFDCYFPVSNDELLYHIEMKGGDIKVIADGSGGAVDWDAPSSQPDDDEDDFIDDVEEVVDRFGDFLRRLWKILFG
jgi:hypothetical protein